MKKFAKFLLWSSVFLALLLACDQLLLRVPLRQPALAAVQAFYRDFRARLIGLGEGQSPATIDQVIEKAVNHPAPDNAPPSTPATKTPAAPAAKPPAADAAPRYLYVDGDGNLQFADRLEDVPARFREAARRLGE